MSRLGITARALDGIHELIPGCCFDLIFELDFISLSAIHILVWCKQELLIVQRLKLGSVNTILIFSALS